uniref:DUF6598 domain-containing protein n=1 Tax=Leersia perrieri TaxID=77586 RepID=A0A0D9XZZ0_9ORYZ
METGGISAAAAYLKRLACTVQEELDEPKRPRDGNEEEEQMLDDLRCYRSNWTELWSEDFGDVEKRTELAPMRYTEGPVPRIVIVTDALEIFSFEVRELNGIFCWPINVFGFISVRDSLDRNRNYIFERTRDNCQTLTAEDSSLVLTGPSRGVLVLDPVEFEIELRVKGTNPSEDKILSAEAFEYNGTTQRTWSGSLRNMMISGVRSILEFKYAHLPLALEATIKIWVSEGLTDFCGKFTARNASINENVILLDSRDEMVAISNDGSIQLSRSVVVVDGDKGTLFVGAHATRSRQSSYACTKFFPGKSGLSRDTLDVGFCRMSIEVAWSLISI